MNRKFSATHFKWAAALALSMAGASANAALLTGDIAFTSVNADEDGFSIVAFTNIDANTTIYFTDNEWNGSAVGSGGAFNTGESFSKWDSGVNVIAAGTVIRFNNVDNATLLGASAGTFSRETVSGSANWGISTSIDTVYAYLGSSATSVTTFLGAISTEAFTTTDAGTLTNTGLTDGVNALSLSNGAGSEFGQYTGVRSGLNAFEDYKSLVSNVANWSDLGDGSFASTVPNTTAFTVTAVPIPAALPLLLSGLAGLVGIGRRRAAQLAAA